MSHNLFNQCCHFVYSDAVMWLKCVWHSKKAIFTQNFAMSMTPGKGKKIIILDVRYCDKQYMPIFS